MPKEIDDIDNDGVDNVRVVFTDAIKKFIDENGERLDIQKAIEAEIESIGAGTDDGPDSIYDIFFHVLSWKGDHNVILTPNSEGTCLIADLCVMTEQGTINGEGPMKGKKMFMPRPLSMRGDA